MPRPIVTLVARGTYRVEHQDHSDLVYVAGPSDRPWAFWNGELFHPGSGPAPSESAPHSLARASLRAPMPATVVKVLVKPGSVVESGEALVILEAMKMELVLRAPADGTVAAVHCREGDLVQPETVLVEFA
jgi:3-methylcrotonyl-CoA carboxylase alpha subunit